MLIPRFTCNILFDANRKIEVIKYVNSQLYIYNNLVKFILINQILLLVLFLSYIYHPQS